MRSSSPRASEGDQRPGPVCKPGVVEVPDLTDAVRRRALAHGEVGAFEQTVRTYALSRGRGCARLLTHDVDRSALGVCRARLDRLYTMKLGDENAREFLEVADRWAMP